MNETALHFKIAAPPWNPRFANPFETNGGYENYSALFLTQDKNTGIFNGTSQSGLYHTAMYCGIENLSSRIVDFVHYENSWNRTVILGSDQKFDFRHTVGLLQEPYNPYNIRKQDPAIVVHSTNAASWQSIQTSGLLLSSMQLHNSGIEHISVGFDELHEPQDYRDYIMFGRFGHTGELIVLSQQVGRVCTQKDRPYTPGVRLYFDAHKMIRDKIITRDGLHCLKVRSKVRVKSYLLGVMTAANVNTDPSTVWTPERFSHLCDEKFQTIKPGR